MVAQKKNPEEKKSGKSQGSDTNQVVLKTEVSREDQLIELQKIAKAAAALAEDPKAFEEAYNAYRNNESGRFIAVLERVRLGEQCIWICRFICQKSCHEICRRFCPDAPAEANVQEMIAFAQVLPSILEKRELIIALLDAIDKGDPKAWQTVITQNELRRFCHQLCHIFCHWNCRRKCRLFCPEKPIITRVGSIPVDQIDANGFGNGPSVPPFHVGARDLSVGRGDHPFGASIWLMGMFNLSTATEYLVEVSTTGAPGSYTPVIVPWVEGYNVNCGINPVPPCHINLKRYQSTGVDPGWFKVSEIFDSDGGPTAGGEKTLLYWPSSGLADGKYYLRLSVRDGAVTRVSDPQVVQLDNTGPFPLPRPTISLQLQKADGTRSPLKCGSVKKEEGLLIVVTVHAYDPHYSRVLVSALGNSNASTSLIDTTSTPLSKTYSGNPADQGYPVPTEFLWDPWNDPTIQQYKNCCWIVYVEVWDRAILNDYYGGGHYNVGWEAIEIGF
jgi:hypothetical protein